MKMMSTLATVRCGAVLLAIAAPNAARGQTSRTSGTTGTKVGDGTLVPAPGSPYTTDLADSAVATGDFNGDGLSDVAFNGGIDETLTILLASPTGGFVAAPGSPIFTGIAGGAMAVADYNRDGNLDIAVLGPFAVEIFLGDGHGGFRPVAQYTARSGSVSTRAIGFGAADFNRDGNIDLAYVYGDAYGGIVTILLGDGSGNFSPAPGGIVSLPPYANQLTIADFNNDGNPDVAVTLITTYQVAILLGDGTGRLSPSRNGLLPTGLAPIPIGHGDFNGDRNVDLAVCNRADGTLTVLLGDGKGNFTPGPYSYADVNCQGLAVGDFDGDGIPDLAVTSSGPPQYHLDILIGDGKGGFQGGTPLQFALTDNPVGVALGDFNGDGRLDAAVSTDGTGYVFLGASGPSAMQLMLAGGNPTVGVPFQINAQSQQLEFDPPTGTTTLQDGSTTVATSSFDLGVAVFAVTVGTAGLNTFVANYAGDFRTYGSTSPPLTVNVAKGNQNITFPPLSNHSYGDQPFTVPASSSSGLPVALTVLSGPATISSNLLTLTGAGTVTLQASQTGNANYLPAASVDQTFQVMPAPLSISAVVNAASYSTGSLAPDSYGVVFGTNLATLATPGGLAPTLGGTSIRFTDQAGNTGNALLYYASPTQVNFLLPSNLSVGTGTLAIATGTGPTTASSISIAAVAPGLFSADSTGTGVAAGSALLVSTDGVQMPLPISSCSGTPVVCSPIPIDLGSDTDTVYLTLYGTGIRGRSALSAVSATIGGIASAVQYAGSQPDFPGLDQVNVQINPALRGRGKVEVALSVNGVFANVVNVVVQ